MPTTLIAVTGLSPAIITETLWALAQEKERILPNRIVFITTLVGQRVLASRLFTARADWGGRTVWQALREAVGAGGEELIAEPARIISRPDAATGQDLPLEDIQTAEENELTASFILEEVRKVVENPENKLICSIGGGRKTMGTLLYAAVSLLGRETDRVTHVLVNAPYEGLPDFFFPSQPGGPLEWRAPAGTGESIITKTGRAVKPPSVKTVAVAPAKAELMLTDVPFVPLRNRFKDLGYTPGTFRGLVQRCSQQIKADAARPPVLEIRYGQNGQDHDSLAVDGIQIPVRRKAMLLLHFLLETHKNQDLSKLTQNELADAMNAWMAASRHPTLLSTAMEEQDFRHELSYLRKKLQQYNACWRMPKRLLRLDPFILQVFGW